MSRFRDRRTPIWVTEVGWASGDSERSSPWNQAGEAAYVRKMFGLLAKNRERLKLAGVI